MNRYQNGKIYKIVDVGYNKCYIGSTCESLSKRMERHRKCYKLYQHNGKVDTRARLLFEEFGVENCKIELIENYACESKEELLRKEGQFIQCMECVNKCVAGRTPQEYKQQHKEHYKQLQKERYEKNKNVIKQTARDYWHTHKEERHEYQKQHYQQNKNEINKTRREDRFLCECGSSCSRHQKQRHFKTSKHQEWLKQQEPEKEPELSQLD